MIEIPEPPTVAACGACNHPLRWLYSPMKSAWVAFVATDRLTLRYHDHPPQDPATWRDLRDVPDPRQAERNAAGRAAVEQALKSKTRTEGEDR